MNQSENLEYSKNNKVIKRYFKLPTLIKSVAIIDEQKKLTTWPRI